MFRGLPENMGVLGKRDKKYCINENKFEVHKVRGGIVRKPVMIKNEKGVMVAKRNKAGKMIKKAERDKDGNYVRFPDEIVRVPILKEVKVDRNKYSPVVEARKRVQKSLEKCKKMKKEKCA